MGRHDDRAALIGRPVVWCVLLFASALIVAVAASGSAARAQSRGGFFPVAPRVSPSQASPGNFFSLLFGGLRPRAHVEAPERPRIVITPRARGSSSASWGSGTAYCVRTCDGRYFPLQGRAVEDGALAQCNAFCPAATMAIYTSADSTKGIDAAVSRTGKAYSELPNAFVYRQRLVEGCNCTAGSRIGGLNQIDVMNDPTLRRGDVVMTEEGSRVFAGGRRGPPYREADFVEPARFPDLSRDMRARLSELEMASR